MTDIERLEKKIDLIIRSLGLDGSKTHSDIIHLASKKVEEIRMRQLTKKANKSIKKACQ